MARVPESVVDTLSRLSPGNWWPPAVLAKRDASIATLRAMLAAQQARRTALQEEFDVLQEEHRKLLRENGRDFCNDASTGSLVAQVRALRRDADDWKDRFSKLREEAHDWGMERMHLRAEGELAKTQAREMGNALEALVRHYCVTCAGITTTIEPYRLWNEALAQLAFIDRFIVTQASPEEQWYGYWAEDGSEARKAEEGTPDA